MPRLDHARIGCRHVDLTELREEIAVVDAEDLHQEPAFVGHHPQGLGLDVVNPGVLHRRVGSRVDHCGVDYLPKAPNRFVKVPMPASENVTLKRLSCWTPES